MNWETINSNSQITAIHAALLPTELDGVVLYFGDWAVSGGVSVQNITHGRLYHVSNNNIETVPQGFSPDTDAFCCGQSFLADGRLLAAGGTLGWAQQHHEHPDHYDGERACWIYLPKANQWVRVQDLNSQPNNNLIGGGRWYPTLVTLGNGEVFATGGHPTINDDYPDVGKRHNNNTPERYSPGANKWTLMTNDITAPNSVETDSYPRYHVLPSGLLFFDTAGADTDNGNTNAKRLFNPYEGVWEGPNIANLATLPNFYNRGSEATSVLLPLLPNQFGAYSTPPRILATNSGDPTAFYIDVDNNPSWQTTANRTGDAAGLRRDNGCATLLPTGQVLVTGGWPGNAEPSSFDNAVVLPEIYTPGIDWDNGDFSHPDGDEWTTIDSPAPTRRGYHSVALLLPDGRVWHGGSTAFVLTGTDENGDDIRTEETNRDIEAFEPGYIDTPGRPTISSCPANIGYGMPFNVDTPQANSIARVALLRCGAMTHGFNADQRYVGLQFSVEDSNTITAVAPPNGNIAPPGYYMLWIIDDQGRVCQRASFIRVSKQKIFVTADISTFSIHEVNALGLPAQFNDALYVAADGFLPSEVTTPTYSLLLTNNDPVPGVTATFGPPKHEGGASQQDVAQRIVYPLTIRFNNTDAFDLIPDDEDFLNIVLYARMDDYINFVTLQLSKNPNPRMSDGDPPWLSMDLRVFKTNPGDTPTANVSHPEASEGAGGAYGYIQDVLEAYNSWDGGNHPFDSLPMDQDTNRLELGTNDVNGDPVFNYAIARVRFRAPEDINAVDVKAFFRMWNTGWTALEFDTNKSYRRSGNGANATPLLGLQGGEVNNIPCFAEARSSNMENQTDNTNRRTLEGAGSPEVYGYFGCWLDINQDVPRFPLEPTNNGPFGGDLLSIQELMRGLHQCLVAEIYYQLDPTLPNSTPGSSDNLAQRNILFDFSDNPGSFAAHIVHHTFELEPSPFSFEQTLFSSTARLHPDELVIDWGGLPKDSLVTLYMPQVDAEEIVRANSFRQSPENLTIVGPGSIMCKVTDIGFMPIPGPLDKTIAGLFSVQLPPGVPYGKTYKIILRQVSGRRLKVLGTTEFRIKVDKAEVMLPSFLHNLAILKHIALSIPVTNRWYLVFQRYLAELGDRIRAFGGDPDSVVPSPHGLIPKPDKPKRKGKRKKFTGKVSRMFYNCFGKFEGVEIQGCDKKKRFVSHQCGVEEILLTACRSNIKVTVIYVSKSGRIKSLYLSC